MKFKLKELNGEVFATVFLGLPPIDPVGVVFKYQDKHFKILHAVYTANDKDIAWNEFEQLLIVTEVPNYI